MLRVSDLRHKDIINIMDGRRLGFIRDVDIDLQGGQIRGVVVPGETAFFAFFTRAEEIIIPWTQIKRIGVDVILVELENNTPPRRSTRREIRKEEARAEREEREFNTLPGGAFSPLDYEGDMELLLQKEQRRP